MVTIQQYVKGARGTKRRKKKCPKLLGNPQRRAICIKVNHAHKPKKPNSAKRKTATVIFKNKKRAMCSIPGQGHNVSVNMELLIRGGRKPDLPGVKYHIMRKKLDFQGNERFERRRKRSKYGLKNLRLAAEYTEKMKKEIAEGKHAGLIIYNSSREAADDYLSNMKTDDKGRITIFNKEYSEEDLEWFYLNCSMKYLIERDEAKKKKEEEEKEKKEGAIKEGSEIKKEDKIKENSEIKKEDEIKENSEIKKENE